MDFGKYQDIAEHMKASLSENNCLHTYRVLNYALQILETEKEANAEVVILSVLLHDIGRMKKTSEDSEGESSHAQKGSKKSNELLAEKGYSEEVANQVSECIISHSRSDKNEPQTLEAKILFDADKLDMTGAVGVARAIISGRAGKPLYLIDEDGFPLKGKKKETPSLFRDYKQELEKITGIFYTEKAQKIAIKHQKTMDCYFEQLLREVDKNHETGMKLFRKYCK